jgi:hypothetical protein
MAYIGVNATADFVSLDLNNSGDFSANVTAAFDDAGQSGNIYSVPSMQEVTVNATPGIFRWKQLDTLSEKAVTTSSTNSIALTVVLDDTTFYSNTGSSYGILDTVNGKHKTAFRLYWSGTSSTDRYIEGEAYLSALAPTVTPDSPVWTSPLTLEIIGDFSTGQVA